MEASDFREWLFDSDLWASGRMDLTVRSDLLVWTGKGSGRRLGVRSNLLPLAPPVLGNEGDSLRPVVGGRRSSRSVPRSGDR